MPQEIPMQFPIKGIVEDTPFSRIPAGFTPRALNVWPFDRTAEKMRGGKRAGLKRIVANPVDAQGTPILKMKQIALASSAFINPGSFFTDPNWETEGWEPPPPPEYLIQETFNYTDTTLLESVSPYAGDWTWTKSALTSGGSIQFIVRNPPGEIYAPNTSATVYALRTGSSYDPWSTTGYTTIMEVDVTWARVTTGVTAGIEIGAFHNNPDSAALYGGARMTVLQNLGGTGDLSLRGESGSRGSPTFFTGTIAGPTTGNFTGTLKLELNHDTGVATISVIDTDGTVVVTGSGSPTSVTTSGSPIFTIEFQAGISSTSTRSVQEVRIYQTEN